MGWQASKGEENGNKLYKNSEKIVLVVIDTIFMPKRGAGGGEGGIVQRA